MALSEPSGESRGVGCRALPPAVKNLRTPSERAESLGMMPLFKNGKHALLRWHGRSHIANKENAWA